MARPLRIEYEGAVYHVTSRGNARESIYFNDSDRKNFLETLAHIAERFSWLCHSYCLMDNHYHLLIETPEGNLSRGMRQLNGVYTQTFNKKYKRVGHLFQGRYKAILIESESYLLLVSRYIVLNPVRAGMVKKPEEWRWSSYRVTVGKEKIPEFLRVDWILSHFGRRSKGTIEKYMEYVMEGIGKESPFMDLKSRIILGSEKFIEKFQNIIKGKEDIKEIPRIQRYAYRPSIVDIFKGKAKDKKKKDMFIHDAYRLYGYRMNEIADYLKVHYSTISRAIKRMEKE